MKPQCPECGKEAIESNALISLCGSCGFFRPGLTISAALKEKTK